MGPTHSSVRQNHIYWNYFEVGELVGHSGRERKRVKRERPCGTSRYLQLVKGRYGWRQHVGVVRIFYIMCHVAGLEGRIDLGYLCA